MIENDVDIEVWMDRWKASDQTIEGFLALANANGLSFPDTLELHRWIICHLGREYIKTWGNTNKTDEYPILRDGGYYALTYVQYAEWEDENHIA